MADGHAIQEHRVHVRLAVGSNFGDSIVRGYIGNADTLINKCRVAYKRTVGRLFSNDPDVVRAFQYLHRVGEIELVIEFFAGDGIREFEHDIDGHTILPWPDEFFEIGFYIMMKHLDNREGTNL